MSEVPNQVITLEVSSEEVTTALHAALTTRRYGQDDTPLMAMARGVVQKNLSAFEALLDQQAKIILADGAFAAAVHDRLTTAIFKAVEEKAGSLVRSLSKEALMKLLSGATVESKGGQLEVPT